MNSTVTIRDVKHGSAAWLELRSLGTWNASEAPIIMGDHPKMSREELMHAQVTMTPKDFDDYVLNVVFEEGHATEDKARKIVGKRIGEELYRVTVTNEQDGYVLLSSLDGATEELNIGFEHKQWAMPLVAYIEENNEPPPFIYWQLEHQLATVPQMEKILLVVSDGTEANMVVVEYRRVPGRWDRLLAGWKQYQADKKAYVPKFKEAKLVGIRPASLPVPTVEVFGELTTKGNLKEFDEKFRAMVASFNTDLKTDQDFAQANADVKYMEDLRKRLEQSKKSALDKAVPLSEAFALIDQLDELARVTALNLEKQIKTRKDNRKTEIANAALSRVTDAVKAAQDEFRPAGVDFGKLYTGRYDPYLTMKGLKSFDSMASKVDSDVTKALLDIGQLRDKVRDNIAHIQASNKGIEFLFRDMNELVVLENNILQMMVIQRIRDHQDKLKETETARINGHRQSLVKLEAVIAATEGQPIEMLRLARRQVESTDTSKFEEFAAEGAKKKQAALDFLNNQIAMLEEKELAAERQAQAERDAEAKRVAVPAPAVVARAPEPEPPPAVPLPDEDAAFGSADPLDAEFEEFSDVGTVHAAEQPTSLPASARPTNDKIISVLTSYFAEDRDVVLGWLRDVVRTQQL